jgi:hypothetical protein
MIRTGEIPAGSKVLYAHLGGQPALPASAHPNKNSGTRAGSRSGTPVTVHIHRGRPAKHCRFFIVGSGINSCLGCCLNRR